MCRNPVICFQSFENTSCSVPEFLSRTNAASVELRSATVTLNDSDLLPQTQLWPRLYTLSFYCVCVCWSYSSVSTLSTCFMSSPSCVCSVKSLLSWMFRDLTLQVSPLLSQSCRTALTTCCIGSKCDIWTISPCRMLCSEKLTHISHSTENVASKCGYSLQIVLLVESLSPTCLPSRVFSRNPSLSTTSFHFILRAPRKRKCFVAPDFNNSAFMSQTQK